MHRHRLSMKKTIYINGNCCLSKLTTVARCICYQLHLMVPVYRAIVTRVCMISKKNVKIIRDFLRIDKKLTQLISLRAQRVMAVFPERIVVRNGAAIFFIIGKLADSLGRLFKMVSGDVVFRFSRQGVTAVFHGFVPLCL